MSIYSPLHNTGHRISYQHNSIEIMSHHVVDACYHECLTEVTLSLKAGEQFTVHTMGNASDLDASAKAVSPCWA